MYRLRDLWRAPSLISLLRVPLAVCFPVVAEMPGLALLVLAAAGLSDVVDGWVARRYGMATALGATIDPITDKLFVLTVAVTLVWGEQLSWFNVLLLSTRELGELPLVVWLLASPAARSARAAAPSANAGGKVVTMLQFAAVAWTVTGQGISNPLLWVTAIAGVLAAIGYWKRALRGHRLHARARTLLRDRG